MWRSKITWELLNQKARNQAISSNSEIHTKQPTWSTVSLNQWIPIFMVCWFLNNMIIPVFYFHFFTSAVEKDIKENFNFFTHHFICQNVGQSETRLVVVRDQNLKSC